HAVLALADRVDGDDVAGPEVTGRPLNAVPDQAFLGDDGRPERGPDVEAVGTDFGHDGGLRSVRPVVLLLASEEAVDVGGREGAQHAPGGETPIDRAQALGP